MNKNRYTGKCLCGEVVFEVEEIVGPFELCHCSKCRKSTGSAYAAMIGVSSKGYKITSGLELIESFTLPVEEKAPGYTTYFCSRCGSKTPNPKPDNEWFEIPAGLFDCELPNSPDRHIYVDHAPEWEMFYPDLPRYTKLELRKKRKM